MHANRLVAKIVQQHQGLRLTFQRVASRSRAARGLICANDSGATHHDALKHMFTDFYPALQKRERDE